MVEVPHLWSFIQLCFHLPEGSIWTSTSLTQVLYSGTALSAMLCSNLFYLDFFSCSFSFGRKPPAHLQLKNTSVISLNFLKLISRRRVCLFFTNLALNIWEAISGTKTNCAKNTTTTSAANCSVWDVQKLFFLYPVLPLTKYPHWECFSVGCFSWEMPYVQSPPVLSHLASRKAVSYPRPSGLPVKCRLVQ